jgi:cytoskeleton protein RodZ
VAASEPSIPSSGTGSSESPEPIAELVDLGHRLRRAREGRGIGMAELADRLHLAPEQLLALENGDRSHLQEPVFVIAQAKRVAQALGVDVSQQVESLRHSRLLQPLPHPTAAGGHATPIARGGARSSPGAMSAPGASRWLLGAALAVLTLLLGLVAARAIRLWGQPRPPRAPARAGAPAGASRAMPGVLLLRSDEPSWLEVRNGSGQVLFSGMLEKEARFRLGEGLRVLAGRPDLVTAAVGGEAPRRLGRISEVGWQDFAPSPPVPAPAPPP